MKSSISRVVLATKPDGVLAELAGQGNEAAFAAIVDRHRRALLRHCRALLPTDQADDAVQLTFLRALQALRAGTEVREMGPWLHRIARNVAYTELAAQTQGQGPLDEDHEDRRGSEEVERRAELRAALGAVAALPEPQRAAVISAAGGASHAVIARELGVSVVAARQILHRARTVLRTSVQAMTPPPVLWVARRISGLVERVPPPPPGLDAIVPKLAAVIAAAALVATPALRHMGEALVGSHSGHRAHLVAGPQASAASGQGASAGDTVALGLVTAPPPYPGQGPRGSGVVSGGDRIARGNRSRGSSGVSSGAGPLLVPAGRTRGNRGGSSPTAIDASSTNASSGDSSSADPNSTDSSSTDPSSADSSSTDQSSTDPSSTDSSATDPSSTAPTSTDQSSTDPTSTDQSSTDPTSTDPTSTDPGTTPTDTTSTDATSSTSTP